MFLALEKLLEGVIPFKKVTGAQAARMRTPKALPTNPKVILRFSNNYFGLDPLLDEARLFSFLEGHGGEHHNLLLATGCALLLERLAQLYRTYLCKALAEAS